MARSEKHRERARIIARMMFSGRWTPSVKAELREKWYSEGCKAREFAACEQAARIAVETEIGSDQLTRDELLCYARESLAELKSLSDLAMRAFGAPNTHPMVRGRYLDSAMRAHPAMHAYLQLLLGEQKRDEAGGLPEVPPEELLKLLEQMIEQRKKGGPPDGGAPAAGDR